MEHPFEDCPKEQRHPVQTFVSEDVFKYITSQVARRGWMATFTANCINALYLKLKSHDVAPGYTPTSQELAETIAEQIFRVQLP